MFTAIINGILAMSMVTSIATTTATIAKANAVANEATNVVMTTVFRTEKTEEIVYDLAVVWHNGENMKFQTSNHGEKGNEIYTIRSYTAGTMGGVYDIDFVTEDGGEMNVQAAAFRNLI